MTYTEDFIPGDPVRHVIGKAEEQPARRHGRQKPKPVTAKTIHVDIKFRMEELAPLVREYARLEKGLKAIEKI